MECREALKQKLNNIGSDINDIGAVKKILGITVESCDYYIRKLINGLCKFDSLLYWRLTKKISEVLYNEELTCPTCGKPFCIKFNTTRMLPIYYCRDCRVKIYGKGRYSNAAFHSPSTIRSDGRMRTYRAKKTRSKMETN